MNAAFLLVTTAWLAGADAAPAAPAAAPATTSACCGNPCDSCGGAHAWKSKFSGMFNHGCGCESSCKSSCDTCHVSVFDKLKARMHSCNDCNTCKPACHTTCKPACKPACNTCDSCGGLGSLKARFSAKFHHGCDTCCGSAAPAGTKMEPIPAPKGDAPKKMPDGAKVSAQLIIEQ